MPDLKLLRLFACVVRHQGFAAAQQELNLSTSAISTYTVSYTHLTLPTKA